MLAISDERGHQLFRKLEQKGIVTIVDSGFSTKLFVKDYLSIEDLDRKPAVSKLDKALKSFQNEKKEISKNIEAIHTKHKEKKQKLFADLEKQLKAARKKTS